MLLMAVDRGCHSPQTLRTHGDFSPTIELQNTFYSSFNYTLSFVSFQASLKADNSENRTF